MGSGNAMLCMCVWCGVVLCVCGMVWCVCAGMGKSIYVSCVYGNPRCMQCILLLDTLHVPLQSVQAMGNGGGDTDTEL